MRPRTVEQADGGEQQEHAEQQLLAGPGKFGPMAAGKPQRSEHRQQQGRQPDAPAEIEGGGQRSPAHRNQDGDGKQKSQKPEIHYFLTFCGRCQPARVSCLARDTVSASGGESLVSVVPAPSVAPRPTRTGATSWLSE